MNKLYARINWENYPSENTPINEQNLNRIDGALDGVDDRVIQLSGTKADKIEISDLFSGVSLDEKTGIITFTRKNGATVTIDTPMEKIQTGIYYDPVTEMLTLPLIDGTTIGVDLSRLITEFEFLDSETIAFSVGADGKATAIVKDGSIGEKHLRPDYLADIRVESARAEASANESANYAKNSSDSAILSKSWAVGGTNTRDGEDTNNSEYYAKLSKKNADDAKDAVDQINKKIQMSEFDVDENGYLIYTDNAPYLFSVDDDGMLNWEVA